MARQGYLIMDSDLHMMEPDDLWARYLEGPHRANPPRFFGGQQRQLAQTSEDKGNLYYHPVMEELKPGEISVEDIRDVGYCVVQLQSFDPGRQLSYQEAEKYVDESLQNVAAQKLLDEFLARHRKKLKIEVHPELVMRIRLVDPLDQS